jgi:phosphonate transport system ATP-binding protein
MIKIEHLSKTYPNGVKALKDVSLEIHDGEFLAVLGLSGAGKSTLLRCINRIIEPTEGHILFEHVNQETLQIDVSLPSSNTVDITTLKGKQLRTIRTQIGMIFQSFNIIKRMSVLQNVLSGRVAYHPTYKTVLGIFPEEDKQIAYQALQKVDILEKTYMRASELSGGQMQRVAIARSIAQQAKILLADEPVASLDPITTFEVMAYIKKLNTEDNMTVVANLHHVDLALKYATRIVGVRDGQIVYDTKVEKHRHNDIIRDLEKVYGRPITQDDFVGDN